MFDYRLILIGLLALSLTRIAEVRGQYEPNWDSLDTRPVPAWYDEAKIGIFLHWGVYSVPSFYTNAGFWYTWVNNDPVVLNFMKQNYPPDFTYADFAPMFHAEFYDPNRWADIFEASGARYVVLTTKHHEGFTNWPSKVSFNWNAMDVGPKRDLVGEFAKAIKAKPNLHLGLYHSLLDWYHPLYMQDKASGWKSNTFPQAKAIPELHEIVNGYEPEIIWSDGDWEAPDTYWNATGFLAWLYNESPVKDFVVNNDRWGSNIRCHHGSFFNCDDHYHPGVLPTHKWEDCMTIDRYSWGYRRNAVLADYLRPEELIAELAETVSNGGNILINVGPTSAGIISPIFEERLTQLGQWLGVNGEAIYKSRPWTAQNDTVTPGIWYTSKKSDSGTSAYAIVLKWPTSGVLTLGAVTASPGMTVSLLGYSAKFDFKPRPTGGIDVTIPVIPANEMPCKWAWVFKLSNLA
jgi:alpha-L-fucosidase